MGARDYYQVIDEESAANDSQQLLIQQRRPSVTESDSEDEFFSQEKDLAQTDYSYQKKVCERNEHYSRGRRKIYINFLIAAAGL